MPCSTARRLANQRNAQKSTGPRSEDGKRVSRFNSTTHGLRGEAGVVPAHLTDAVAKHVADLVAAYHPQGGHQLWLLNQAADAAARLDECQILMRAELDDQRDRADRCWDEDREVAVEALATRLPGDPARVSRRLRQTAHGCFWLLARWHVLSHALTEKGGWDQAQIDRAFQLLGLPDDLRGLHPYITLEANPDDLADLVREQVDGLQTLLDEALDPLNTKERDLTRMGLPLRPSAETLRLRRYETRLRRTFHESLDEFRRLRAEGFTGPEPADSIADCGLRIAESVPVTALEPEPEPVADPLQISELEPEPLPRSPDPRPATGNPPPVIPQSAIDNPQSAIEAIPNPQPEGPLADAPQTAKLVTLVDEIQSDLSGQAAPEKAKYSPPKKASKEDERKARRQRQKAARKRARSH